MPNVNKKNAFLLRITQKKNIYRKCQREREKQKEAEIHTDRDRDRATERLRDNQRRRTEWKLVSVRQLERERRKYILVLECH